ncbi:BNR repeat-containing protein [Pseudomonas sp. Marseille-QA0892]
MLKSLKAYLTRWLGKSHDVGQISADSSRRIVPGDATKIVFHAEGASGDPFPYDESLLERSRTQWQFGDWESLARLDRATLQYHPDRAKLALLAAAGRLQTNRSVEASHYLRLAKDWGVSKKLISQILIAGVHNSLARAAILSDEQQWAMEHFNKAILIGTPGSDRRLITQARIEEQYKQLGLPTSALAATSHVPSFAKRPAFSVTTLATHNLGDAWAGNTINTVIFRHHGILTHDNIQYTAFYVDTHTLRLVQRDLRNDALTTFDLHGEYNLRDAHNSISMGVDRQGHLHLSYDHHATQLRYRRSIEPRDISAWTEELPMTGSLEEKVTYPSFILPRHGFPLTFLYRDGVHDKGTARIKTYDETTRTWTNHPKPILSGSEQKPWTSNAYWNHPAVGTDGSLHLSFVWRTHTLGEEQRINNINIGYACSYDNGITWQTSRKRPYKLPITQVNAETICPVSPGSNLINQTSMALDSHNRPHIAFYADDPDGIPQYQHLWFDGKVWRLQIVSIRNQTFSLQGGGTLQIPISRPEIVIDRQDNVYFIARGDHTGNRMAATFLPAPDYRFAPNNIWIISDQDLGFAEPVIDRARWQQENVLSLLRQHNQQPNNDACHQNTQSPVDLIDIILN